MTDTIPRLRLAQLSDPPAKPALSRAGALRLDQAELFLLSLDNEMLTADSLRAAYLLGLAEVHLAGLIELIRAVTP
jgi:hypothetical protein